MGSSHFPLEQSLNLTSVMARGAEDKRSSTALSFLFIKSTLGSRACAGSGVPPFDSEVFGACAEIALPASMSARPNVTASAMAVWARLDDLVYEDGVSRVPVGWGETELEHRWHNIDGWSHTGYK